MILKMPLTLTPRHVDQTAGVCRASVCLSVRRHVLSRVLMSCSSSRIWNGMIHPLLELPIFGAIWHQGTSRCLRVSLLTIFEKT